MIDRLAHLRTVAGDGAADVVARRHGFGAQIARDIQQVAELDRLIATDAGDRRLALQIRVGELVDHRVLEPAFVIQNIMRDADHVGGQARVMNVLARAAGALFLQGRAMIVKLKVTPTTS